MGTSSVSPFLEASQRPRPDFVAPQHRPGLQGVHPLRTEKYCRKEQEMSVRKVVTRSGKRFRGKFPSKKNRRLVEWESLLERDALMLLEYHPAVLRFQEQPSVEIYYDGGNCPHRYVPDLRVEFWDGRELVIEVKPSAHVASKEVGEKLGAIAKRMEELGRSFRVLTELEIRSQPRFDTLQLLHSSSRRLPSQLEQDRLLRRLQSAYEWTYGTAASKLGSVEEVHRLVAARRLHINLQEPLTNDTLIWIAEEGVINDSLCF